MRKLVYALLATAIASPAFAQDITVGVTAIVEHPALDAVRDGVRDALAAAGFEDGDEITFVYESAQGDGAIAAQIANQFVGEGYDIIVPISTPSAQTALAATSTIPIVFAAVTDPVAAGLVTDLDAPGGNITGTSDLTPVDQHVALIQEIVPDVGTIGVIYNPGEANAVVLVDLLKQFAGAAGLSVVEATANSSSDVQAAAQSLVGRVDAIYIPTDNTVVSALESVIGVAEQADIPVFSGDTESVNRGTLASIGFNYYEHGLQAGAIVVRILNGENPGDIAVEFATGGDLVINTGAAERMGVTVPQAVLDRASSIVE
ncbi:MAG: ABC transporter substrate-binding protein [Bauldia sp.]|nr:ABC transporter substrate-binding protein [Bauldia sp.]